jgi:PPOX class probable F420-dependent enzyme
MTMATFVKSRSNGSRPTTAEGFALVRQLGAAEKWLAVLVTQRPSSRGPTAAPGDPSVSLVNAGVLPHPVTGEPVVAFVARGGTAKLANLRARPRASLVFRAGWEWVAVHGSVELVGPDDPLPGVTTGGASPADGGERLRLLLRDVYAAAGGSHPDLAEYDRAMAAERRTVVLLTPERFAANPPGAEHVEPADPTATEIHR